MVNISDLPDELLHCILAEVFRVDDDVFANTASKLSCGTSHRNDDDGEHSTTSATSVPLVCRRWLNVSTPLVYETVLLRSGQRTRCLARTLLGDHTLGLHIRKLRVEGGMGVPVNKILRFAPGLTDLFVELVADGDQSMLWLRQGLEAINPTRVVLMHHALPRYNRQISPLVSKLCEHLPRWTRLTTLRYPFNRSPSLSSKELTAALEKVPNLDTLWVPCGYSIDATLLVSLLGKLGEKVKTIYSESPFVVNDDSRMFLTVDDFSKLRQKVLFPLPGPWAPHARPYRSCVREDGIGLIWT